MRLGEDFGEVPSQRRIRPAQGVGENFMFGPGRHKMGRSKNNFAHNEKIFSWECSDMAHAILGLRHNKHFCGAKNARMSRKWHEERNKDPKRGGVSKNWRDLRHEAHESTSPLILEAGK